MPEDRRGLISVVSAVFNGERYLRASLVSVLSQEGAAIEVIVVDDGSTDGTPRILAELASHDPRLRIIRQDNAGLTAALVRGCAEARGEFIARHDADDLCRPGRLAKQQALLESQPGLAMVSSWGIALGPAEEVLFEVIRPADAKVATAELLEKGVGPAGHGSVLFRSAAYRQVGGYRPPFRFAQDWDLWLRLAEHGGIGYVPEFLYGFRVDEHSISSRRREQQVRLAATAERCRQARIRGEPEAPHLAEAARISTEPAPRRGNGGDGSYFIGKLLLDRRDRRALSYLWRSVRKGPLQWRRWAVLAGAALLCRAPTSSPAQTRSLSPARGGAC